MRVTTEFLKFLVEVYTTHRGVGHTSSMVEALKQHAISRYCVGIVLTAQSIEELKRENKHLNLVSVSQAASKLRGIPRDTLVLVDPSVVGAICSTALHYDDEVKELTQIQEEHRAIISMQSIKIEQQKEEIRNLIKELKQAHTVK